MSSMPSSSSIIWSENMKNKNENHCRKKNKSYSSNRVRISTATSLCLLTMIAVMPSSCFALAIWGGPSFLTSSSMSSASSSKRRLLPLPLSVTASASKTENKTENDASTNSYDDGCEADKSSCVKTIDILSLDSIRNSLIRQEETIIFALIERAQYRHNSIVYQKDGFGQLGSPPGSRSIGAGGEEEDPSSSSLSFLEWMLTGTETMHSYARRYTSPEEHAFFPERLPQQKAELPQLEYPTNLLSSDGGASDVNFNEILLKKYIDVIVPRVAKRGDDEQHGSTCLADIAALQALSKRVHFGKFVAESKYQSNPEAYQKLVDNDDADGVMELLTNAKVEKEVLRRARLKAATYGREPLLASFPQQPASNNNGNGRKETTSIVAAAAAAAVVAAIDAMAGDEQSIMEGNKVDPAVIEFVYRDIIIPLTKDIEVAYLFKRCGKQPPPEYQPDRMSIDVKQTNEELEP